MFTLADLALDLGETIEARCWAQAALARAAALGRARQAAAARGFLGVISMREGDYATAADCLLASLETWRDLGELYWIAEALVRLGHLAMEQTDVAAARSRLTEALVVARQQADEHRVAAALEGFVQLSVLEGRARLALQLAAAVEVVRQAIRVPLPPAERAPLSRAVAQAPAALGNRGADAAEAYGRNLGTEGAAALALADAQIYMRDVSTGHARNVLTIREQMVARLVAQGLTNRAIAEQLVIAEGTAERHVGNILHKLGMSTRSQIAAWAVGQGLHPLEIPTAM
jgi:DNA-binding NarL/FixJ family response regulator